MPPRPLGDAERTEELAQSLGQPYVHLGMNMPATALPDASPTAPEDVIIWFGIIDILQARALGAVALQASCLWLWLALQRC